MYFIVDCENALDEHEYGVSGCIYMDRIKSATAAEALASVHSNN